MGIRLWRYASVLLLALSLGSCDRNLLNRGGSASPEPGSDGTVTAVLPEMGSSFMSFDFGTTGSKMIGRRYQLFAGATPDFAFHLEFSRPLGEGESNQLVVKSGSGRVISRLRDSDTVHVTGNVAILELNWDGEGEPPYVKIDEFGQRPSGGRFPAEATALSDSVASMPVSLNQPVEVFSRYRNGEEVQFFTVSGVRGKSLDLLIDGEASLNINDPDSGFFFPSSTDAPWEKADASNGHLVHLDASAHDTLLLTVKFDRTSSSAKHVKLAVNEVHDPFELTARFPGRVSDYGVANSQELAAKMEGITRQASMLLYQATAGHSRIDRLKILIGTTTDAGARINMRVDPFEYETDLLREHVHFTGTPLALMEVDLPWWNRSAPQTHAGTALAHELMHQRYGLPDEYLDEYHLDEPDNLVESKGLCPISMLSASTAVEMCWQGNHNPSGSRTLDDRTDDRATVTVKEKRSMWDIYAARYGFAPPDHHPPQVLQSVSADPADTLSKVLLPMSVTVDTGSGPIALPSLPTLPTLPSGG